MEEERNYTVYMHVCKENEKVYIGITRTKVQKRWGKNGNKYKGQIFYKAIQKYGWDNFEHIILFENKTKEEAEQLEILYIKVLMSNSNLFGYNVENGGNANEKITDNIRKKFSESHKGKTPWNKGLKSLNSSGEHSRAKKVICDGRVFDCAKDCAEYYNINAKLLYKYLIGTVNLPQELYDKGLKYVDSDIKLKCSTPQSRGNNSTAKRVICDGIIFDCLTSCAIHYNIHIITMGDWLRGKHSMPTNFYKMGLKYLDSDIEIRSQENAKYGVKKKVICENKIFNSIKECSDWYDVKLKTMSAWLSGQNSTPQEFKDIGLDYYIEN